MKLCQLGRTLLPLTAKRSRNKGSDAFQTVCFIPILSMEENTWETAERM